MLLKMLFYDRTLHSSHTDIGSSLNWNDCDRSIPASKLIILHGGEHRLAPFQLGKAMELLAVR
jgi:hypothetical protein